MARLRRALAAAAILACLAAGALLLAGRGPSRAPPAGGPPPAPAAGAPAGKGPAAGPAAPPAVPAPGRSAPPLEDLAGALSGGDGTRARAAAAALRRSLRLDPAARAAAAAVLLDPAAPADLRRALALVFGTFGGAGNDALLLEVLRRFPGDAALVRCALLGLGGTREPEEDDEVFGLGDRPWGASGPGGLGITVRRWIGDPAVRREAAAFLARPEAEVREAAATALRHSVDEEDVREGFLLALGREAEDAPAEVLGESLAGRAGRTGEEGERARIVERLLARAGEAGLDGYRFRMEDDFRRIPLDAAARLALRDLAAETRPFGVRSFALTAMAGGAARGGTGGVDEARGLLEGTLAGDRDPAARDLAARLLAGLPWDAGTGTALARAAREDAAWNVRFTALGSLASFGARPGVAGALDAAASDADARVAERARELRAGLR